jgi:hypothetical protein
MSNAVKHQRLQPRIAKEHFQPIAGGGVAIEDDAKVSEESV